ncbi:hypothetical protein MTO96_042870 [Rhipicephalus appendiculatus]
MRLMSPTVGLQTEASCVSVWYYMFGARRLSLQLSLSKTSSSSGFVRRESVLLRHRGRTTTDKWYNVQRSVNLNTPHNQLAFNAEVIRPVNKAAIIVLGPVQVTSGPCEVLTDANGYCDFEFDECGWKSNSGWRRQAKLYWRTEPTLDALSGPVNSVYTMTVTPASSPPSGAILTSPKWKGQKAPQCLEFWYLATKGGKATLQDATGCWREWTSCRTTLSRSHLERTSPPASQGLESFSIDEVALRPDACDHPAECDFADGLCGYVNKVEWMFSMARRNQAGLENPRLHRGVRVPQDIAAANVSVHCYSDNVSVKREAVPSFELDEASDWATANLTLEQGTQCQLRIEVIRGSGTSGTMAIASIKVTKSDTGRFIFASIGQNKSFGTAELKSPDLELNATGGACLSFWHFTVHDKRAQ